MIPKVYVASKVWHADKHKLAREMGYNIISRWVDLDNDHPIVFHDKKRLWEICDQDVHACDYVLMYCEEQTEEHRGALIEIGTAYGLGKPVYCVNKSKSLRGCETSDVAFTYHRLWNWLESTTLTQGIEEANKLFKKQGY